MKNEEKILNIVSSLEKAVGAIQVDVASIKGRVGLIEDNMATQGDKVINILLDHEEKFNRIDTRLDRIEENMLTKSDQDKVMVILNRLDQDRVATVSRLDRVETRVARHDQILGLQ